VSTALGLHLKPPCMAHTVSALLSHAPADPAWLKHCPIARCAVGEAAAGAQAGEKRRREEGSGVPASEQLWDRLDDLYSSFAPFRDASLDRWHRKTTLTTGARLGRHSSCTSLALLLRCSAPYRRHAQQAGRRLLNQARLLCVALKAACTISEPIFVGHAARSFLFFLRSCSAPLQLTGLSEAACCTSQNC
jgi:hypothetical protein